MQKLTTYYHISLYKQKHLSTVFGANAGCSTQVNTMHVRSWHAQGLTSFPGIFSFTVSQRFAVPHVNIIIWSCRRDSMASVIRGLFYPCFILPFSFLATTTRYKRTWQTCVAISNSHFIFPTNVFSKIYEHPTLWTRLYLNRCEFHPIVQSVNSPTKIVWRGVSVVRHGQWSDEQ